MNTRSFIIILCAGLLLSAAIGYSVFWFTIKKQMETELAHLYPQAEASGITIEGAPFLVSGFPGKHRIRFAGKIRQGNEWLQIPLMEITGFPLPGQELVIEFPKGISAAGNEIDTDLWSLDYLSLSGPVPSFLPAALTVESLRAWRNSGGMFTISALTARKNTLEIEGYGRAELDERLQPAGYANVIVRGYAAFIGYLENKKPVDPKQSLITSTVMNGLSSQDKSSGERFLKAGLAIQNSRLLLGPVTILEIPPVQWPYEGMPMMIFE